MKKKIISGIISAFMLLNCCIMTGYADEATTWSNASQWAEEELEKAESKQLIPGILNNTDFTQKVTREEFAEISVKVYENLSDKTVEVTGQNPFSDTENTEILKAYQLGITNGMTETTFEPDGKLTREQAAAMLSRAYMKAFDIEKLDVDITKDKFADDAEISDWAKESVYYMAQNRIINGIDDESFAPKYTTPEEEEKGYGCATREQALLIAVRICEVFAKTEDEPSEDVNISEGEDKPSEEMDLSGLPTDETGGQPPIISAEQDNDEKDAGKSDYTICFIGGSLTQGGASWITKVKKFFQEKYPDKNIVTVNAGIGGTGSQQGALRYEKDVMAFNPDLVFIEFAVNDTGATEENSKVYMESMVRRSIEAEKVPDIIFLYTPQAVEKTSETYTKWANGVKWKEQIASHYGLKSINIYNYIYDEFLTKQAENKSLTFFDYLATIGYQRSGEGYNVHGGYVKYGEAILKELEADFEGCLTTPDKNAGILTNSVVKEKYRHIPVSSTKMHYTKGHWTKFTAENKYTGSAKGHDIAATMYSFPYFEDGVRQTETNGAMFGFNTTPGTSGIRMSYVSSTNGASATVTIDGKEAGTFSCKSIYHNVNYVTDWIIVPNDGKSHKVVVTVDGIGGENTVFRFGSIIEKYTD